MNRIILLAVFTVLSLAAVAQREPFAPLAASDRLQAALLSRDTSLIKTLVDPEIGYGHSNGWIESRAEMCRHLYDGTLRYNGIRPVEASCRMLTNTGIVRKTVAVNVAVQGTVLEMKLAVLEIWQNRSGAWTLIARQSCKIT